MADNGQHFSELIGPQVNKVCLNAGERYLPLATSTIAAPFRIFVAAFILSDDLKITQESLIAVVQDTGIACQLPDEAKSALIRS